MYCHQKLHDFRNNLQAYRFLKIFFSGKDSSIFNLSFRFKKKTIEGGWVKFLEMNQQSKSYFEAFQIVSSYLQSNNQSLGLKLLKPKAPKSQQKQHLHSTGWQVFLHQQTARRKRLQYLRPTTTSRRWCARPSIRLVRFETWRWKENGWFLGGLVRWLQRVRWFLWCFLGVLVLLSRCFGGDFEGFSWFSIPVAFELI